MASDRDEQREAELRFSNLLREKVKTGRPNIEDLQDRAEGKPGEPREEEKPERER